MKSKRCIALMWAFALLPLAAVALLWARLPARVPMNWGFDGQVTYEDKPTLWLLTGMGPMLALLFQFLPRLDPKNANYTKFQGFYDIFAMAMTFFLLLISAIVLTETFRPGTVNVARVTMLLLAGILLLLGCCMGKVKTNWFMGFRNPWTMSDSDVWNKTHRLGGWVFFVTGLASVPLALLAPERVMLWALLVLIFGGTGVTLFMSWKWYNDKRKESDNDDIHR